MEKYDIDALISKYPGLSDCKQSILDAYYVLEECFSNGHKLLISGNGGSAADADHIVGELMKGFKSKRQISNNLKNKIIELDKKNGSIIAEKIQQGLPAIALHNHQSLNTAFLNDVEDGGVFAFAEQVLGYGEEGDVLLAISTSGNSKNVYYACLVAKAKNMKVVSLSGMDGGLLNNISDVIVKTPAKESFEVQEFHLPIYHLLCLMLERRFFE